MASGKWSRTARRSPDRADSIAVLRFTAIALALSTSGCSLIGLGVGAGIDARRSRVPVHLTAEHAASLPAGSPLTLVMVDSATVTGVLLAPSFDSRRTELRLAHLRTERPAALDTLIVPVDRVAYARSPRLREAARKGLRIGMTIDLVVLGIAAVSTLLFLVFIVILQASGHGFS